MKKLTEMQLDAIKKAYLTILKDNLLKRDKERTINEYAFFLKGFATALGLEFEQLDEILDNCSMYSIHFIKQQIRFHEEKELFNFANNELKYYN